MNLYKSHTTLTDDMAKLKNSIMKELTEAMIGVEPIRYTPVQCQMLIYSHEPISFPLIY